MSTVNRPPITNNPSVDAWASQITDAINSGTMAVANFTGGSSASVIGGPVPSYQATVWIFYVVNYDDPVPALPTQDISIDIINIAFDPQEAFGDWVLAPPQLAEGETLYMSFQSVSSVDGQSVLEADAWSPPLLMSPADSNSYKELSLWQSSETTPDVPAFNEGWTPDGFPVSVNGWSSVPIDTVDGEYMWRTFITLRKINNDVWFNESGGWTNPVATSGPRFYTHLRYSNFEDGINPNTGLPEFDDIPRAYIGFYEGISSTPPTEATEYVWAKFVPQKGIDYFDGESLYQSFVYITSTTQPPTPTDGSLYHTTETPPTGWSDDPYTVEGEITWISDRLYRYQGNDTSGNFLWSVEVDWSTPSKFFEKGGVGNDGPRTASGYLYYQQPSSSAPSVSFSISNYNFVTNEFEYISNSNWKHTAPAMTAGSTNNYWYVRYSVTESSLGGAQTIIKGTTALQGFGFTGLVTFTSLNSTVNGAIDNLESNLANGVTTIDGDCITTGTLNVNTINSNTNNVGTGQTFKIGSNDLIKDSLGNYIPGTAAFQSSIAGSGGILVENYASTAGAWGLMCGRRNGNYDSGGAAFFTVSTGSTYSTLKTSTELCVRGASTSSWYGVYTYGEGSDPNTGMIRAHGNIFSQYGDIYTNSGDIFATNGDVIAYSSSDRNLKENIRPIESALDKVTKINGVHFDWKEGHQKSRPTKHDVGVIAQEVQEVLPEVVHTRDDGTLAVAYDKLTALLIESVKELKVEVDSLKEEIKELKK